MDSSKCQLIILLGTSTVDKYLILRTSQYNIWAVDTPGFDDTSRANGKVFHDIATFLCKSYHRKRLRIAGLIYIHRISDPRMSNSSVRSIRIFEALCGASNFRAVRIVTTMWDVLTADNARDAAIEREQSLQNRDDFFGSLVKGEARFHRHGCKDTNSLKVIESLLNYGRPVKLAIVREMREGHGTTLLETSAGRYLQADLKERRAEYETKLNKLEEYRKTIALETDEVDNRNRTSEGHDGDQQNQDRDEENDLRTEIQEIQEHIRFLEENGADTKYLTITYVQLLEEGRDLLDDGTSSEDEQQEDGRAEMKDFEGKPGHRRQEPEAKDVRQVDQAGRTKEQSRSNDDRSESGRSFHERLTRAKKERRIFGDLLYWPRKSSVPNIQDKESPQKKTSSGSTPPESSPKASKREPRTRRAKWQERRVARQEVETNNPSEPQHTTPDQAVSSRRTDEDTSYFDQTTSYHYASSREAEDPAMFSSQHHFGQDTLFRSPDHSPTFGNFSNVDFGVVSLPRKYGEERKLRYRY